MTWLWNLLTGAWGFFTQQRIRAGDERQHESSITGAQMVVDHQDCTAVIKSMENWTGASITVY